MFPSRGTEAQERFPTPTFDEAMTPRAGRGETPQKTRRRRRSSAPLHQQNLSWSKRRVHAARRVRAMEREAQLMVGWACMVDWGAVAEDVGSRGMGNHGFKGTRMSCMYSAVRDQGRGHAIEGRELIAPPPMWGQAFEQASQPTWKGHTELQADRWRHQRCRRAWAQSAG
jgi:hypothetical protein